MAAAAPYPLGWLCPMDGVVQIFILCYHHLERRVRNAAGVFLSDSVSGTWHWCEGRRECKEGGPFREAEKDQDVDARLGKALL